MSSKKLNLAAFCFALLTLCTQLLYGQATGSFSGTVTDNANAVISGGTVKITSQATGLTREAKTDDSGHYLIPLLPVSLYTIHVEAAGFGRLEKGDLGLQLVEQGERNLTFN